MPPEHLGEPGAEHVYVQQRVLLGMRVQAAVLQPLLDLPQLGGQAAADVAAE